MKYDKLLLDLITKTKNTDDYIKLSWSEFLTAMQLEKYSTRDIKDQIFHVLQKSKLIYNNFGEVQFHTLKQKGQGNKISEILIYFGSRVELEKFLANSSSNKSVDELRDKNKANILDFVCKRSVIKYSDLLEHFTNSNNEQKISRADFRSALQNLLDNQRLFCFCLDNKWDRYICCENDKKIVLDFCREQNIKLFLEQDSVFFVQCFAYRYDLSNKPRGERAYYSAFKKAVKDNFGLKFDSKACDRVLVYEESGKYITRNINRFRLFEFSANLTDLSRLERREIAQQTKWDFDFLKDENQE